MGEQDDTVRPWGTREMKRYFEEAGVNVKFESDPDLGHWFVEDTVAGDIGGFCYDSMGAGVTMKDYEFDDTAYLKAGDLEKWDQSAFAEELSIVVPELT